MGFWASAPLLDPDILPKEGQDLVLALHPGGDLGGVAAGDLVRGQVGGDDGGAPLQEAGVDDLVEGADHEAGGHLGPQVVQDQEVAA